MHRILVVALLSSSALAAAAATPQPVYHASATGSADAVRVTTGITAPQIDQNATVHIPGDAILDTYPNPAQMVVRLDLDATGRATGMRVLQSISARVDAQVLNAVRQFRWRPGVLDGQPIPMTVNLTVSVVH
jgi:TonB family protein